MADTTDYNVTWIPGRSHGLGDFVHSITGYFYGYTIKLTSPVMSPIFLKIGDFSGADQSGYNILSYPVELPIGAPIHQECVLHWRIDSPATVALLGLTPHESTFLVKDFVINAPGKILRPRVAFDNVCMVYPTFRMSIVNCDAPEELPDFPTPNGNHLLLYGAENPGEWYTVHIDEGELFFFRISCADGEYTYSVVSDTYGPLGGGVVALGSSALLNANVHWSGGLVTIAP